MGKATIAEAVARGLGVHFQEKDASSFDITGDFTAVLSNIKSNQILLLSGIQHLKKFHVPRLREVLRDSALEIMIGSGPAARKFVLDVNPFTLIATCPKMSDCPPELLHEFSVVLYMAAYSRKELQGIAESIARKAGIELELSAALLMAEHCDGRPGNLLSVLRRVSRVTNKSIISESDTIKAFNAFGLPARPSLQTNDSFVLQMLTGHEFETAVTSLLVRMGFQAETTKMSGDGGIDIIAILDKPIIGGRYLFQCKRFGTDNLVGAPTIRDFYGAVMADRAVKGIFITTSDFTAQAREFAQRSGVELINLAKLNELLLEYGVE